MRRFLTAAIAALGMAFSAPAAVQAAAHGWKPAGPIKFVIAFRAGGGADTQARLIAEELEARHGWKVIPEQITGKGGANAAAALKDMPNDGTAIAMIVTETLGYNMVSAKKQPYELSDFTGITTTAGFQMGVVALTSMGYTDFNDVIKAAKDGIDIRFGAMSPRLADLAYLIGKENGVDFNIVMAKGGKGVMNGLNAGDMDVGWGAGIQTKAVKAGDMVNLMSGLSEPLAISPDAPLISSFGIPFDAGGQFLIAGPGGMPEEARTALAKAIGDIVTDSSTKANGIISKAFGGPVVIQGDELDAVLQKGVDDSEALLAAVQ
ncbi:MAG: tripartite tricarboxylate transporter substrate-binding protein [Pseudomonadota bacterium]